MHNKVSIIIPAYNTANVISRTLQSVENQTYKNYEVVIVNDGSTDGTKEIIDNYAKNRNNIIVYHQNNQGVSSARNKGIELATGEFICFLDSDDTYEPTFLEEMLQYLINNKNDAVYCGYNYIDRKGHIDIRKNTISQSTLQKYLSGSMFYLSCMLINKNSILNKKIKFSINRSVGEDILFTVQVLTQLKTSSLDRCLFNYIYRKNSIMHDNNKDRERLINDVMSFEDIYDYIKNNYNKDDRDHVIFLALVCKDERILALLSCILADFDFKKIKLESKKLSLSLICSPEAKLSNQRKRTLFFIKNDNIFKFILGAIYYRYNRYIKRIKI